MPKPKLIHTVILVILLLLNSANSGQTATTGDNYEVSTSKGVEGHISRRYLTELQDYDYGGSNSKHDPRRKPGGGH
ncbi:uncharacterized protein LOC133929892 [Phragmites australis]|uniref:uncharacterized protein LOC133929892 n=1 Tax=Phragmites australis TaxID=29695 RepID=UPI002D78D914|nr:uncharacterized protein LOC133929892 [Phragmites australis]